MTGFHKLTVVVALVAGLVWLAPAAQAQLLERKVEVTFSGPVEIPGQVLPAGTYVFDALEAGRLTRVLNADETHIYATLFTVPEERAEVMDNGGVVLKGVLQDAPERVSAWFCPGDSVGSEFIYSKTGPGEHQTSMLNGAAKEAGHTLKESAEFVGRHAEHIVENSGLAVAHAARYLVS